MAFLGDLLFLVVVSCVAVGTCAGKVLVVVFFFFNGLMMRLFDMSFW